MNNPIVELEWRRVGGLIQNPNRGNNGAGVVVESGVVGGGSGGVERVARRWMGQGGVFQVGERMVGEVRDLGDPFVLVAPHDLHRPLFALCNLLRNRRSSSLRLFPFRLVRLLRQNPRRLTLLLHRQVCTSSSRHFAYFLFGRTIRTTVVVDFAFNVLLAC